MKIIKHKKFDSVLPYTYLIKHNPTGLLYHGVRYSNVSKDRIPKNDLGYFYFGSSVTYKELFSLAKFKRTPNIYTYKLCWTFDSVDDALLYEESVNKRILRRNRLIEKSLISGSRFANNCYGKAISQTDEVKEKQRNTHNSPCDCGCGLTKAQCNAIRSSKTRNSDICECRKIPECNGTISTYQCAGLRCRDILVYELVHYKTKKIIKGTQVELSNIIGCQTSHINSLLNNKTESAYGYTNLLYKGSVRVLNEKKLIKHNEKGELSGTITELAAKIGANKSHIGMLFNKASKKVKTVKGWYNPELNEFGLGGYGSGALKNRWWRNPKKQNLESLVAWKNIEIIKKIWVENNKPGYCKFTKVINSKGYDLSRKRVENIIKLFKDNTQYKEMLCCHQNTNFDDLVDEKVG